MACLEGPLVHLTPAQRARLGYTTSELVHRELGHPPKPLSRADVIDWILRHGHENVQQALVAIVLPVSQAGHGGCEVAESEAVASPPPCSPARIPARTAAYLASMRRQIFGIDTDPIVALFSRPDGVASLIDAALDRFGPEPLFEAVTAAVQERGQDAVAAMVAWFGAVTPHQDVAQLPHMATENGGAP
jgi:hypothetical protein